MGRENRKVSYTLKAKYYGKEEYGVVHFETVTKSFDNLSDLEKYFHTTSFLKLSEIEIYEISTKRLV